MDGYRGSQLRSGPVLLRPPRRRDGPAWSAIRLRNQAWLSPWEPTASGAEAKQTWAERNSVAAWAPRYAALRRATRMGSMLPFMIVYGDALAGQLNVSNLTWGALRSCSAGYWVDSQVAGRGIVPTALALVIDYVLGPEFGLHRVQVDIRPENAPSLRVVAKLGLRREGYLERFLDIDGAWRDHISFAVTAEEVRQAPMLPRLAAIPAPPS
jgi:ribosomal-protein-alanine N-acetyltransferase